MILAQRLDEALPLKGEAGGRLGRHVEHDDRSRAFAQPEETAELVSVTWTRNSPILNQGGMGSCTGNALAGAVATDSMWRAGSSTVDETLAVSLYELATRLDYIPGHMPPDDTGSTGNAVCKAGRQLKMINSWRHAFNLAQTLSALQRGPAIVGMAWLTGCDTPDANGLINYSGTIRGGHEVLLRGCDTVTRMLFFDNSWGEGWGLAGSFKMAFEDFKAAMALQGDVTIPVWKAV